MPAFAVFETATIADAVSKAARIAPTKGAAYDRASGLIFEITPGDLTIILRSTDIETTYYEKVNALEVGDRATTWRVQSKLIADILGRLPIASGATVEILENDTNGHLRVKSGRRKAYIRSIAGEFPHWEPFNPSKLVAAPGLAGQVKKVAWACDRNAPPFSGVHITGDLLVATDRYRIATVPLKVPVDRPITVPMTVLTPLLNSSIELRIKAEEERFLMMPDEFTQITTQIYAGEYIKPEMLKMAMREDFLGKIELPRAEFIEVLSALLVIVEKERYPNCRMTIEEGTVHLDVRHTDSGEMNDLLDVDYTGPKFVFDFTPSYLLNALNVSEDKTVVLEFGPDPYRNFKVSDSTGYAAWIMPRKLDAHLANQDDDDEMDDEEDEVA